MKATERDEVMLLPLLIPNQSPRHGMRVVKVNLWLKITFGEKLPGFMAIPHLPKPGRCGAPWRGNFPKARLRRGGLGIRWHFLAREEMPGREGGGPGSHRNNVSMGWPESRFNSGHHVI